MSDQYIDVQATGCNDEGEQHSPGDPEQDDDEMFCQPREADEIYAAEEEFCDKVWYNRHLNMLHRIQYGFSKVVPQQDAQGGGVMIGEETLALALAAAQAVREKYEDTGPWDDFEWGMINGKLSALRWVLGDDWDCLDT